MKWLLFVLAVCFLHTATSAQALKRLADRAKQKIENKVGDKTDQAIDEAVDGKQTSGGNEAVTAQAPDKPESNKTVHEPGIKAYSKFDFVPGAKIVFAEDFSQDVIGEFPVKWNTNGSGEVVTLDKVSGKWLHMTEGTKYQTPYSQKLPDNFTVEFDLLVQTAENMAVPEITFQLDQSGRNGAYPIVQFTLGPSAGTYSSQDEQTTIDRTRFTSVELNGTQFLSANDQLHNQFHKYNGKGTPVHIAVWVQKQRFRAWVNEIKVYDLPRGIPPGVGFNEIGFEIGSYGGSKDNFQYYVSNVKVAEALPDTRSKLITEGTWSTNGILFAVNSDKIQPSSYGVLKEIATTLKENPNVKVKIIGHTDSDGDDAKNMDLSKRRAAAVKAALNKEFSIDNSRMETDGLGETKPVADNNTSEAKAQNRRVEFVKL